MKLSGSFVIRTTGKTESLLILDGAGQVAFAWLRLEIRLALHALPPGPCQADYLSPAILARGLRTSESLGRLRETQFTLDHNDALSLTLLAAFVVRRRPMTWSAKRYLRLILPLLTEMI
jgi:hypothetical protein